MSSGKNLYRMVLSALFLGLALVLPFVTGQIPQIGGMLCPMHFPVLLCSYFCGPWYGMAIGLMAPVTRFIVFGMPPLMPTGIGMCFELGTYGLVAGSVYGSLNRFGKRSDTVNVYISLVAAMLLGRLVWGVVRVLLAGVGSNAFGWQAFIAGAFLNAAPGIIGQLLLIPILVTSLRRALPKM